MGWHTEASLGNGPFSNASELKLKRFGFLLPRLLLIQNRTMYAKVPKIHSDPSATEVNDQLLVSISDLSVIESQFEMIAKNSIEIIQ